MARKASIRMPMPMATAFLIGKRRLRERILSMRVQRRVCRCSSSRTKARPPGSWERWESFAKPDVFLYAKEFADGTGLTGQYYTNSSRFYTNVANFNPANLVWVTNDAVVDFRWAPGMNPSLSNKFYSVRWTGQVRPQF